MKIVNKTIGEDTFIVAEIGINHNGDINIAKKLIDMAIFAGCDAVKFQKRTIEDVYTPEELTLPRESPFGDTNGDLKRGLEFGEKEYEEIDRYCKERGIIWFASPWDLNSINFLEKFNVPCYKVASAMLTNDKLLERLKSRGKPIILSTGMSTVEQIDHAVEILRNPIILHCTSTYPSKPEELNLKVIPWLRERYKCFVGYSGHDTGIVESVIAVAFSDDGDSGYGNHCNIHELNNVDKPRTERSLLTVKNFPVRGVARIKRPCFFRILWISPRQCSSFSRCSK